MTRLPGIHPRFRLFLAARTVSWMGSAVTLVALPVLLYQRTHSPALTGLLTAVEALPYLVFGLLAGALVDRWPQRRVLVVTSWASAAVIASVPVASGLGVLSTTQLLLAALLTSALFVFFDAAGFGVVPALVGSDNVAGATSSMMSIYTVIGMAGPAVGGALATAIGPAAALSVDALSYAVAAVLLARLRWTALPRPDASLPTCGWWRRTGTDIGEGLRYIKTNPIIRALTLLGTGNSLTGGAVTGLVIVVAVRQLGMSDHDSRIGTLFAAASIGSLAATIALPRLQNRFTVGAITLSALAVHTVTVLAWGQVGAYPVALIIIALMQAAATTVSMNGIIVRQTVTPSHLQGRVNSTARMIAYGGQPVGAAAGGLLASHLGSSTTLAIAACGTGACFLLGLSSSLRCAPRLPALRETAVPTGVG